MAIVEKVATPFTAAQGAEWVTEAWLLRFNQLVEPLVGIYCLALAWVESGAGKHENNNNPGNVSCYPENDKNWKGDCWLPPWKPTAGKPLAFRAYPTQQDGWNDFVREFARRPSVVAAARADNAAAFVKALHDTNYSKDYAEAHVKTFASIVEQFKRQRLFFSNPVPPHRGGSVAS